MMTFNTPGGQPPAGMPAGPQAPQQGPGPGGPPQGGAGAGPDLDMIMQIAQMVLGHPPQNEQELMQVIQVMAAMGQGDSGAASVASGRAAQQPDLPASNTAMVKAVNGGM